MFNPASKTELPQMLQAHYQCGFLNVWDHSDILQQFLCLLLLKSAVPCQTKRFRILGIAVKILHCTGEELK